MFGSKVEAYVRVQSLIAISVSLGELINGYGVGWSAPVLPKLHDPDQSPIPHEVTATQKYWIVTMLYFGCVGGYLSGYLANRMGRKRTIVIGAVMTLISYVILTFANSLTMMYIGRLFAGISIYYTTIVGLIYIGEIASSNIRGIVLTSMGFFHASGSLLVYSVSPFADYAVVGYVNICLTVIYIGASCLLPESPMYYVLQDDEISARSVLEYLGRDVDINNELKTMVDKVQQQKNNKYVWKELFLLKCNRKSLFISVFLAFFQQSSGIIPVILFANTIFGLAGSSIQPDMATIIVGATLLIGTIIAPIFIDKYGRRVLLLSSTAGLSTTMTLLGVYFYLREIKFSSIENFGWVPLALLILAQFAFSIGMSIIPNTIAGELFTPKVRGLGPSISYTSGALSGLITVIIYGYIVLALGIHFAFWWFAISNALAFVFVILFIPETMGKSLMEIQEMLEK